MDDDLKALLVAATRKVCLFCDREFIEAEITGELYTPIDEHYLWCKQYPVTSVESLKIWDTASEDYVEEDSANYTLVNNRYIYYPAKGKETEADNAGFDPEDDLSVKLDYTHGYDNANWDTAGLDEVFGTVPAELEWATAEIAHLDWQEGRGDRGTRGVSSQTVGQENYSKQTFLKDYPPTVVEVLERYSRAPGA